MLQQVCEYIRNYFDRNAYEGDYSISAGVITPLPLIKEGQRFRIDGSDLNDGVYTYHEETIMNDDDTEVAGLQAESFTGSIIVMAVPPAVIALIGEINSWVEKYGVIVNSPFSSENINGLYGYTKTTKSEDAGGGGYSWQDIFKSRLNRWRKPYL